MSSRQQIEQSIDQVPIDNHDQMLLGNVHPDKWINPTPSSRYNLVVVGAGSAGLVTAAIASGLGGKVALIERNLMGGDCLNFGCVPSKTVIRCSRAAAAVTDAERFGINIQGTSDIDFSAVMERVRRLRAQISKHDSVQRFTDLGIDVFLGDASFTAPDTVQVDGISLRFSRACIATGARASAPPIQGLDKIAYHTNETIFSLTESPHSIAIIGAGPIGCELAQAFSRLGVEVHILEIADRILIREDSDVSKLITASLVADGVTPITSCSILNISQSSDAATKLITYEVDGEQHTLKVHEVMVGAGRAPNVQNLGLENAGVEFDPRTGITVNDHLRTTNRRIFAAGDCCTRYQFTHTADAMAQIVVKNALFFGRSKMSKLVIPWSTYTDPEIAHVGLTSQDFRDQDIDIHTIKIQMEDVDRAVLDGETNGFLKVHLKKGTSKILGATLIASHASEMISELTAIMTSGGSLADIGRTIHCYPTQADIFKRAANEWNRSRFSPKLKRWTTRLLSWRR